MADIGTGTVVTFGTSSWSPQSVEVDPVSFSRPALDTTHLGTTTARTYMAGDLYDGGEMTMRGHFDPAASLPPIDQAAETITIDFSGAGAGTFEYSGTGFMTAFDATAVEENVMSFTATIKWTGAITPAAN